MRAFHRRRVRIRPTVRDVHARAIIWRVPSTLAPVVQPGTFAALAQPTLEAGGLELRPWQPADSGVLVRAYNDAEIVRWHSRTLTEREAHERIAERSRAWTEELGGDWAVLEGDAVAGRVSIRRLDLAAGRAEVGYWVLPECRGRRLAARSVAILSKWLFAAGLHRLEIEHAVENRASCAVALRAGFRCEGTRREGLLHADGWHDMHLHARLADDPEELAAGAAAYQQGS